MGDVAAGIGGEGMGGTGDAPDDAPDDAEVVQFADPARGTYKKLVIRKDRLVGAILLGDVSTVGTLTQAFDRGRPLPADRLPLLFTGLGAREPAVSPALLPADAKVCVCNAVTKAAIVGCVLAGARCVDDVAARTRATTGCGIAGTPSPASSNGSPTPNRRPRNPGARNGRVRHPPRGGCRTLPPVAGDACGVRPRRASSRTAAGRPPRSR